jgi:hypothetical protein
MQYIKHYWIDTNTGTYSSDSNPVEKRHPEAEFPGLGVKIWMHDVDGIDVCLSQVPDGVIINNIVDNVTGKTVVKSLTEEEFNSVQVPLNESYTLRQEVNLETDETIKAEKLAASDVKYQEAVTALYAL